MKKRLIQNFKIGIFAVCTVAALIFTVFAFLPGSGAVEISEAFTLSSVPIDLSEGTYEVFLRGVLRNKTDRSVTVEQVVIEAEGAEQALVSEAVVLPPRSEGTVEIRTVTNRKIGNVKHVKVTAEGAETELLNPASGDLLGRVWLPSLLTILFAVLTAHAIVIRVYLHQAERASQTK